MPLEITTYIAIYGAILSTIAIAWNFWKYLKNKPSVKVSASIGFLTYRDGSEPIRIYSFEAVNDGKRPITLTNVGIKIENNQSIQFIDNTNLPKKLNEGDKVTFFRKVNEFYPEIQGHEIKYLWFKDTLGKEYISKNVKNLFAQDYRSNPSQQPTYP